MGYMFMVAACINCRKPFTFNPEKVPSIVVGGQREPLCRPCVNWANPIRKERGLAEIKILPGAYEEAEVYP